jgi:DNA-binding response OmpR family regulator
LLVVEPDLALRELLVDLLSDAGYEAERAPHGEKALARLESVPPVDLVLVEARLPDMPLATFCERKARIERAASSALIVMTADRRRSDLVAADAVLLKPFGMDELLPALANVAGSRSSRAIG